MNDIKITYVSLRILLFVVFLISGYFLSKSKTNKQYWKNAILPIVAFAIISGLRFGRDVDYNVYYLTYSGLSDRVGELEVGITLIINLFNSLAIPYYGFVLFCSTFLIVSFLYLLYNFKKGALYILPLFLTLVGIENLIRWYLAFSFILLAVRMLMDKHYIRSLCFLVLSWTIHEGMLVIAILIVMFYMFANKKILFPPRLSVILFGLLLIVSSVEYLQQLTTMLKFLQLDFLSDRGQGYIERVDEIAAGEFGHVGIRVRDISNKIRQFVAYGFPLYFFGVFFKKYEQEFVATRWLYNLGIFSIIIMPLFTMVEIFDRISAVLMCFSIIMVGYTIFIGYTQRFINKKAFYCLMLSFLFLVYPIIKTPFDATENHKMMFIWDANGREYLNPTLFLKNN